MTGWSKQNIILILSFCGLAAIFSSTLSKTPVLPLYAAHLGASDSQVGWIAAASTVPGILISYFAGAMADRYGWRRLLLTSMLIFATAPFFYLLVTNSLQLAGVRFYHGIATAILGPVAMAAIISVSKERKGEMLSLYSSYTMVGRALAPFAGGFLLSTWNFNGLFLVCIFVGTLALILSSGFWWQADKEKTYEPPIQARENVGLVKNLFSLLSHRKLFLVGILEAAVFFTFGAFEITFPLYAKSLEIDVWQIGIIMSLQLVGVIFFKPIFGRLSDRIGRMPVIFSGLALCALSIAGIPFWQSVFGLGLLNVGFGIGFALVTSSTRPFATELAQNSQTGASLGLLSTMMDIGQVAGPIVTGMVSAFFGYQTSFLMLTTVLILTTTTCVYTLFNKPS